MKNQLDRARVEPMPSSTWIENHTIKPTAHNRSMPLLWFRARLVGRSLAELLCQLNIKPPWPNGQGAPLLRVRLWVRVPLGVLKHFFFQPSRIHLRQKNNTPCGTQTHNLQIRSLTRYSVAPTGRVIHEWSSMSREYFFFQTKKKSNAPGGTRTPDPGLIRPMLYQTELPEQHPPHTWDRTKDLHIISQTLTQLSYMGTYRRSPRNW